MEGKIIAIVICSTITLYFLSKAIWNLCLAFSEKFQSKKYQQMLSHPRGIKGYISEEGMCKFFSDMVCLYISIQLLYKFIVGSATLTFN